MKRAVELPVPRQCLARKFPPQVISRALLRSAPRMGPFSRPWRMACRISCIVSRSESSVRMLKHVIIPPQYRRDGAKHLDASVLENPHDETLRHFPLRYYLGNRPAMRLPPAQLTGIRTRLRLFQNGYDLFFAESTLSHDSSSWPWRAILTGEVTFSHGLISGGQVTQNTFPRHDA